MLVVCCLQPMTLKAQTTVFSEDFEASWTSCAYPNSWTSDRSCGGTEDGGYSTAWHRNDDEGNNWHYTSGDYSPGAQNGSYSARFHSYGISSSLSSYIETPSIDLSTYVGGQLDFYYINEGGSDDLEILFYDGSSWNSINTYTTQSGWGLKTITITPAYQISNFKIRFLATSDYGASDIGVDYVTVTGSTPSNISWTGGTSTDWDTASNWSGSAVPTAANNVTIPTGTTYAPAISASATAICNDLIIDAGATLTIGNTSAGSGSFDINADLTNNGNIYHTSDLNTNLNGANNTIGGTGDFAYSNEYVSISITDGANYTLANNITLINQLRLSTGATFNLSSYTVSINTLTFDDGTLNLNTGVLEIGSSIDYTAGTFNANTSTVYFNSGDAVWTDYGYTAGNQTINSFTYHNLKVRTNNGYTVTIGDSSATTVTNDLTLLNPGTAGGVATTAYDVTVGNDLYLGNTGNALTLNLANRMYRSSGTGTFTMGNVSGHAINASYSSASNYVISGFGTPTFYGTFTYNGTGTQKVVTATYNNLTSTNSGTRTQYGNVDINGDATFSGGNFQQGTYAINVAGNWTSTGNYYEEGTGTVTFDGSGTSTVSGTSVTIGATTTDTLKNESFENGGSIPSGWGTTTVSNGSGPGGAPALTYVSSSSYPTGFSATQGSYFVKFNGYSAKNNSQIRLKQTTSFSSSGYTNIVVKFDWTKDDGYSSNDDYVNVQYSTDGSTWTTAGSNITRYSASGDSWTSQSITLPTGAENQSTLYIAFLFTSKYGNDCHLDNVIVTGDITGEAYTGEAFNSVDVNKSGGGDVTLSSKVYFNTSLTFTQGIVNSSSSAYPEFDEDAVVGGTPSATSHVDGPALKRTNTTTKFTFPVGDGTAYRSIAVTPSGTGATNWTGEYFPTAHSDLTVTGIDHVSSIEYWTLDRSGASPSNATIELSWDANNGVDSDYSDLVVAHYDGTDWESAGGNNIVGNSSAGTLDSDAAWSSYSPFTFGSNIGIVPLPVTLTKFVATPLENEVQLDWETTTEINNDFFTLERSADGINFEFVTFADGAGNSSEVNSYRYFDRNYNDGINYYRLRQTDFDGTETYAKITSVLMTDAHATIISTVNILGQKVGENYKGLVFDIYSNGTSNQRFQ